MTRAAWLWPGLIAGSALAAGLVNLAHAGAPLRAPLALWFLLVCPGMAFVRLLRLREIAAELMLAVALSIALDTIVAGTLLYAGHWSPGGSLAFLIAISLCGVALQILTLPPRTGSTRARAGR